MTQIQSGQVYTLVNAMSGTALDLSGGDNTSIIGFNFHGGGNQKWMFEQTSQGPWTIRSLETGKYLNIEGPPSDGAKVVAIDNPQNWDIWHDEQDGSVFRLFIPGTTFNIDMSDHGNATPGTPVTLWGKWEGKNQTWRIEPGMFSSPLFSVFSSFSPSFFSLFGSLFAFLFLFMFSFNLRDRAADDAPCT
ncbi:ricin B-like lectin [Stereum hirsutum FP-91666 SS1]|uniref:ricin B-like lectin n=1 Tax=Stereum hirsutum (strain FP-91666) TaxID=721885 RepID=UPI0004449598|nr:ricin B-like lectin [Stereum hirsutum FP-91666 SS1]EIM84727.1 ricin B-like lectin [Stereum hirsutum FP-91666 SS1]